MIDLQVWSMVASRFMKLRTIALAHEKRPTEKAARNFTFPAWDRCTFVESTIALPRRKKSMMTWDMLADKSYFVMSRHVGNFSCWAVHIGST